MGKIWLLAIVILFAACNHAQQDAASKGKDGKDGKGAKKAGFVATVVQPSSIESEVRGIGTLQASEQIDVKSEIAGRIVNIAFKEGQAVQKGDLLIKINDADLLAQKLKAQANLDLLKATQTRRKQQLDLQAISQQDYDQSAANVASAQGDLDLILANLSKTEIRAPFSGTLGLRQVGEGAVISAGQIITSEVQLSPVKAQLSIPGESAVFAKVGQVLKIHTVNGEEHSAKIYATDGVIDESSRSLVVRAYVDGKGGGLIPGSAVEFQIKIPQIEGYLLPPEVVAGNAQGTIVYKVVDGKAVPVPVTLGQRTVDRVQIAKGVEKGDTVLCVGASNIRPGMPVDIVEMR